MLSGIYIPSTSARAHKPRLLQDKYLSAPSNLSPKSWLYFARGSRLSWPGPGVPPLWFLALRSILRSINSINADHMRHVRPSLLELMWARIRAAELDSVRVWQVFAPALYHHRAKLDHRLLSNGNTTESVTASDKSSVEERVYTAGSSYTGVFADYFVPATSPAHTWLVDLELAGLSPSKATDLLAVGDIVNLHSLSIRAVTPADADFDDRIVRAWGLQAADTAPSRPNGQEDTANLKVDANATARSGRFRALKFLSISQQPAITAGVFRYLDMLPALISFEETKTGIAVPFGDDASEVLGDWTSRSDAMDSTGGKPWQEASIPEAPVLKMQLHHNVKHTSGSCLTVDGRIFYRHRVVVDHSGRGRTGSFVHDDSHDQVDHEALDRGTQDIGCDQRHVQRDGLKEKTRMRKPVGTAESNRPAKKRRVIRPNAMADMSLPWL